MHHPSDTQQHKVCFLQGYQGAYSRSESGLRCGRRADGALALDEFAAKWDSKYPKISKSRRENWPELATYFKYPQEIRTLIYTTNAIENFNRQLRKVTKNKAVFPNDDALLKMLYLAAMDITRKWTGKRKDWTQIHAQIEIFFGDRMPL